MIYHIITCSASKPPREAVSSFLRLPCALVCPAWGVYFSPSPGEQEPLEGTVSVELGDLPRCGARRHRRHHGTWTKLVRRCHPPLLPSLLCCLIF